MMRESCTQRVASEEGGLKLTHFQRIKQLGSGDVGMVDLVKLRDTDHVFAMKTLDKREMVERNKVRMHLRVCTRHTIAHIHMYAYMCVAWLCPHQQCMPPGPSRVDRAQDPHHR